MQRAIKDFSCNFKVSQETPLPILPLNFFLREIKHSQDTFVLHFPSSKTLFSIIPLLVYFLGNSMKSQTIVLNIGN